MFGFTSSRWAVTALVVFCTSVSAVGASGGGVSTVPQQAPANIVVGFVGGFVRHNNPHHGPVQLAQRIRQTFPQGTYVRVFENRRRRRAYETVLRLLDSDHDGT